MEFFSGFKWAVPIAFSETLSLCRFEQGDTLYDTPKAYDDEWGKASQHIEYYIQVQYPDRVTGVATEIEPRVFAKNWNSEVRLDLYKRLEKVGVGQIRTTQGRLYTTLWKGNLSFMEHNSEAPQLPISVQRVTDKLDETAERARNLSNCYPIFVMARDLSNAVSREKYSKVLWKLKNHLAGEPKIMNPQSAGLSDWAIIAPTIDIAFFASNGISADELHNLIKEAVYVPAKDAKKEMFRIKAHGIIF